MSLLFPAMLAGLLALGVPVLIHLIARHKYLVQDFPSLRLLRADERTNVFALRLVDIGQLLLRLLVLLLLVLAMSRLFAPWLASGTAPRNLVVVVDCSASMRMLAAPLAGEQHRPSSGRRVPLIELAKSKARELLAEIRPPSHCGLIAAGEEARPLATLATSPERALQALDTLEPSDGSGSGLVRAVAQACDLLRGRREVRSQVVVLTDLRATAFEARNQRDLAQIAQARRSVGRPLEILFVNAADGLSENVAVVDAAVRGGDVRVGDDAHVVARVVNFSEKEKSAKLRLAVGKRREPLVRDVLLEPHGTASVDLTARVSRAARTFVQVEAEADDPMPYDNSFRLPLHVADARRVLIVNGASQPGEAPPAELGKLGDAGATSRFEPEETLDGARILRFVLNPGRELGRATGTGIAATVVAPEALAAQTLSKYDAIVLYDVSTLPEPALKDLDTFVRQGRALLHVCSGGVNAMRFNRTFAAAGPERGVLSPSELGNERVLDPPAALAPLDWQGAPVHPLLAPFRDRLKGDLSAVRFAKVREVRNLAKGASAILTTGAGLPLAVEMPVERGRIVLLAFGLELDRGNLARTRVFPALVWRLMDYLTGRLRATPPDVLTAHRPAVLSVSEPAFAFVKELDLVPADGGIRRTADRGSTRLRMADDETCLVEGLPAGNYVLQKAQATGDAALRLGYARLLAVNPDPKESDTTRAKDSELAALFGSGVRVVDLREARNLAVRGAELWRPLVLLLIAALAAEGIIGWLLSARREKERSSATPSPLG